MSSKGSTVTNSLEKMSPHVKSRNPIQRAKSNEYSSRKEKISVQFDLNSSKVRSMPDISKNRTKPLNITNNTGHHKSRDRNRTKSLSVDLYCVPDSVEHLSSSVPKSLTSLKTKSTSGTIKPQGSDISDMKENRLGSRLVWHRSRNTVEAQDAADRNTMHQAAFTGRTTKNPHDWTKGAESHRELIQEQSNTPSEASSSSQGSEKSFSVLGSESDKDDTSSLQSEPPSRSTHYWKLLKSRIESCEPADIVASSNINDTKSKGFPVLRRQTFPFQSKGSRFYNTVLAAHAKSKQRKVRKAWSHDSNKGSDKASRLITDQLSEVKQFKPKFKCSPHFQQILNTITKDVDNMFVEEDEVEEN